MLRRLVGRGDTVNLRADSSGGVPSPGYHLPLGRVRLSLQNPDSDEARRYQDRQAGEADDPNRCLLRHVHRACSGGYSLSRLRECVHGPLDGHLEQGNVLQARTAHCLLDPLSCGRTGERSRKEAGVRTVHDQVPRDDGCRDHVLLLDLVREDSRVLEELLQQTQGAEVRGLSLRKAIGRHPVAAGRWNP